MAGGSVFAVDFDDGVPAIFDLAITGPRSRSLVADIEEPGRLGSVPYNALTLTLIAERAGKVRLVAEVRSGGDAHTVLPSAAYPVVYAKIMRSLELHGGFDVAWTAAWVDQAGDYAESYLALEQTALSAARAALAAAVLAAGVADGRYRLRIPEQIVGRVPFVSFTSIDPEYIRPAVEVVDATGTVVGVMAEDRLAPIAPANQEDPE